MPSAAHYSKRLRVAIWVVSFFVFMAGCSVLFEIPQLLLLCRHSATTEGQVVRFIPNSHGSVIVRYASHGNTYERSFSPHLSPEGSSATVYYYPNDPTIAVLGDPRGALWPELVTWSIASAMLSSIVCYFAGRSHVLFKLGNRSLLPRPRVIMTLMMIGAAVGGVSSIRAGLMVRQYVWIGAALQWSGGLILTGKAFSLPAESGWAAFAKTRLFALGIALVILGNLVLMFVVK